MKAAAPSIVIPILSSLRLTQPAIAMLANNLYLPVLAQSIIAIQCLVFATNFAINHTAQSALSLLPIFTATIITLALMQLYSNHRSHKHGCLLNSQMKSQAVLSTACIIYSSTILCQNSLMIGLAFLLGSLFVILFTSFFAACSDVWYAIGSRQFHMVSLDAAGMIFYFFVPATVLYLRFVEKYGVIVGDAFDRIVANSLSWMNLEMIDGVFLGGQGNVPVLVFIISATTAIGVPFLNSLCPIGGYLFAKAYIHGQPNTRKLALIVNFSDLGYSQNDTAKAESVMKSLEETNSYLNVVVTLDDLESSSTTLKNLEKKGHNIVLLASSALTSGRMNSMTLFKGDVANNTLKKAFDEFNNILGRRADWVLSKSSYDRHPLILQKAHELGMKFTYWSTLVQTKGAKLSNEELNRVLNDVKDKNGGSIIYITLWKYKNEGISVWDPAISIVQALEGYTVEPLSQVVKDDKLMGL